MIASEKLRKDQVVQSAERPWSRIFQAAGEIYDAAKAYQVVFRALTFIEFFQLAFFTTSQRLQNTWRFNLFVYFNYMTSFLQIDILPSTPLALQDGLVISIFCIIVTMTVLLIALPIWMINPKKVISTVANLTIKVLAFYIILFETILIVPFSQICYYSFSCAHLTADCSTSALRPLRIIIASLCLVLILLHSYVLGQIVYNISPFSQSFMCQFKSRAYFWRNLVKIIIPLYLAVDPQVSLG